MSQALCCCCFSLGFPFFLCFPAQLTHFLVCDVIADPKVARAGNAEAIGSASMAFCLTIPVEPSPVGGVRETWTGIARQPDHRSTPSNHFNPLQLLAAHQLRRAADDNN